MKSKGYIRYKVVILLDLKYVIYYHLFCVYNIGNGNNKNKNFLKNKINNSVDSSKIKGLLIIFS